MEAKEELGFFDLGIQRRAQFAVFRTGRVRLLSNIRKSAGGGRRGVAVAERVNCVEDRETARVICEPRKRSWDTYD